MYRNSMYWLLSYSNLFMFYYRFIQCQTLYKSLLYVHSLKVIVFSKILLNILQKRQPLKGKLYYDLYTGKPLINCWCNHVNLRCSDRSFYGCQGLFLLIIKYFFHICYFTICFIINIILTYLPLIDYYTYLDTAI